IEALPYDRANTSMESFTMCPQCQAEYDDPANRRFHAQPNACPVCGPHLELWNSDGKVLSRHDEALLAAAEAIRLGQIVAGKGIGGFHLIVDARNDSAVCHLRERKHREEKPLALMFPTLESVKALCEISPLQERLLRSPEAPIVLLKRTANRKSQIANSVAPGNPNLGVMLPYTPLHHLLMAELAFPVVATSGNLSDEPICTDEREAIERLGDIADLFLVHNRPIVRHVDDSVVRVMLGREMVLRRARGYAPLPVSAPSASRRHDSPNCRQDAGCTILAVGAHLKNNVALSVGGQVFISQHIGDLDTGQAFAAFQRVISDLERLYEAKLEIISADLHPDYLSTKFAQEKVAQGSSPAGSGSIPAARSATERERYVSVQHHIAHVLSCMVENELEPPVLGVSWDGTGYGLDGTIWGGEFFLVTDQKIERAAHFRPFRLPGGDKAVKEPRRAAAGLLFEMFGEAAFERTELPPVAAFLPIEMSAIKGMLARNLNSPLCCSVGRLFDAVASLIGLRQRIQFEGQAATELEFTLDGIETDETYQLAISNRQPALQFDWSPMIEEIIGDLKHGVSAAEISAKFHNALAESIVRIAKQSEQRQVALSGGCFQNRYLTERTVMRLREEGFQPYWHQRVPPNDGGISLGQVVAALRAEG
ncbi:MAG TPA: carbamoyltransferase HypF, partial [Verrucomicrobiae bacterium]|nr:carbamoyltransferase HypF [Verrucomicrobiae bacterium]